MLDASGRYVVAAERRLAQRDAPAPALRIAPLMLLCALFTSASASAIAQTCKPLESDLPWPEQLRIREQEFEQEQCLCGVPAYAHFYSRAFGRGSCHQRNSAGDAASLRLVESSSVSQARRASEQLAAGQQAGGSSTVAGARSAGAGVASSGPNLRSSTGSGGGAAAGGTCEAASDGGGVGVTGSSGSAVPGPETAGQARTREQAAAATDSDFAPSSDSEPTPQTHPQPRRVSETQPRDPGPQSELEAEAEAEPLPEPERYIVRFDHYAPAASLRAALAEALGPEAVAAAPSPSPPASSPASAGGGAAATADGKAGGSASTRGVGAEAGGGGGGGGGGIWTWVPRDNAAAAYPTDFALVAAAAPGGEAELLQRLNALAAAAAAAADGGGAAARTHASFSYASGASAPAARAGGGSSGSGSSGGGSGRPRLCIRDVHPDKRYSGALRWLPEEHVLRGARGGAGGGGSGGGGRKGKAGGGSSSTAGGSSSSSSDSSSGSSGGRRRRLLGRDREAESVAPGRDPNLNLELNLDLDLDEAVFSVSRRPGRMVTRFSEEGLAGELDPESELELDSHQAWRHVPGSKPDHDGRVAAEAAEAAAEDGGLTGSRRRMASAGGGRVRGGGHAEAEPDLSVAALSPEARRRRRAHAQSQGQGQSYSRGQGGAHGQQQQRLHTRGVDVSGGSSGSVEAAAAAAAAVDEGRLLDEPGSDDSAALLQRALGRLGGGGSGAAAAGSTQDADHADLQPEGLEQQQQLSREQQEEAQARIDLDLDGLHRTGSRASDGAAANEAAAAAAADDGFAGTAARGQRRRLNLAGGGTVPVMLEADKLWKLGYTGRGVRVGIFDTGIRPDHPHIRHIRERTNWTHQQSLSDGLGHGTFVAGVVGGQDGACPGFAPDVEMLTFKVFTDDQVSYTSWFLDAFNYAIVVKVNVINLSIGGPDYLDQPFVDKVLEITSNGVLLVSAIGNDGPLYGTLNNPADQNDVIGVGGIDNWDNIASFSSRGMSTWELPRGYGRVKPDVMAYAKDVQGSKITGGCRSLSGTSVASPVVAGAVSLLASTVLPDKPGTGEDGRWALLNPGSMKQALVEGAVRLPNLNIYEQGSGRINLPNSMAILQSYTPRASIIPSRLDLTDCPYMWPFCRQHLYAGALPVIFNATLLNGQGVVGRLEGPPVWLPADAGGRHLHIDFEWSETLWPWSGYLALYIRVKASGKDFEGPAVGAVECVVVSPPAPGEDTPRRSVVRLPVRAKVAPPPPRARRLLWDQFHSLKYPPAYLPRDNLDVKSDILDWHGDHPHTNFHGMFNTLRDKGYFLEILGSPATCFDPTQYGAYLIVDPEEEWYAAEVSALEAAVAGAGLSLLVFADWYNVPSMDAMRFFDDNTRSWWTPATGGSHVPGLNDLLAPYGLAYGDAVLHGSATVAGNRVILAHGADVAKVPKGGWLHKATLHNAARKGSPQETHGYLAAVQHNGGNGSNGGGGYVVVFSDSNCLDRSHMSANCYDMLLRLLARVLDPAGSAAAQGVLEESTRLSEAYVTTTYNFTPPARRPASVYNFTEVSYVLSHPVVDPDPNPNPGAGSGPGSGGGGVPVCFPNAACDKMPSSYKPCQVFLGRVSEELPKSYSGLDPAADNPPRSAGSKGGAAGSKGDAGGSKGDAAGGAGKGIVPSTGGANPSVTAMPVSDGSGGGGSGVGKPQVLVVHPDGSAPPVAVLQFWPLGKLPLLLIGFVIGGGLLAGLWASRGGFGFGGTARGGGGAAGGGGGGSGGDGSAAAVPARRGGWGSVRQRGSEV